VAEHPVADPAEHPPDALLAGTAGRMAGVVMVDVEPDGIKFAAEFAPVVLAGEKPGPLLAGDPVEALDRPPMAAAHAIRGLTPRPAGVGGELTPGPPLAAGEADAPGA